MNRDLHHKRSIYKKSTLEDNKILNSPFELFDEWFKMADNDKKIEEANCMTLSTTLDQIPRARIVLLKEYSTQGFVFYTNYLSKKGQTLNENPEVCLNFFWPSLEKQIIINGKAEKVSAEQSDAYFASRPRGSQMGALISAQSQVIPSRESLEKAMEELSQTHHTLQRPIHWGGYIVKPYLFEFWQGRPNRLHDRIEYYKDVEEKWQWQRLSP